MLTPFNIIKNTFLQHFNYAHQGRRKSYNKFTGALFRFFSNQTLTQNLVVYAKSLQARVARANDYNAFILAIIDIAINVYYNRVIYRKDKGLFENELIKALNEIIKALEITDYKFPTCKDQKRIAITQINALIGRISKLPTSEVQVSTDRNAFIRHFKDFLITGKCPDCTEPQFGEYSLYYSVGPQDFCYGDVSHDQLMSLLETPYRGLQVGGYNTYINSQLFIDKESQTEAELSLDKRLPDDLIGTSLSFL